MEHVPIEWILDIPPVTRCWTAGILGVAVLEQVGVIGPLDLYFSMDKIFNHHQYYRFFTSFLYFGRFSIDLMLSVFFVARSSRSLEESLPRTKDYMYMLFLIGSLTMLYCYYINNIFILGPLLDDCLLYVWARRNANLQVSFFGLVSFSAAYLPLFYSGIGLLMRNGASIESTMLGLAIGHVYYFLSDISPKFHSFSIVCPPWDWNFSAIRDSLAALTGGGAPIPTVNEPVRRQSPTPAPPAENNDNDINEQEDQVL